MRAPDLALGFLKRGFLKRVAVDDLLLTCFLDRSKQELLLTRTPLSILRNTGGSSASTVMDTTYCPSPPLHRKRPRPLAQPLLSTSLRRLVFVAAAAAAATAATTAHAFVVPSRGCINSAAVRRGRVVYMGKGGGGGGGGGGKKKGSALQEVRSSIS